MTDNAEVEIERNDRLSRWVASCLGVDRVALRPLLGGASNLGFVVHDGHDHTRPVAFLRVRSANDDPGRLGHTLRREGEILRTARQLGFPVAPVLGTCDHPDAILMAFVPGISRPDEHDIERVAPEYLGWIARIHRSDPSLFPVEQHATVHDAMTTDLAMWALDADDRDVLDEPLLAMAHRVLIERMPPGDMAPSLLHGDVGAGNFLTSDGEVTALLDWELAHLGDPHEDLAWLWMRGAHTNFGDPFKRFAEYEAVAGTTIDHDRLAWHLAFVMWKSMIAIHGRLRCVVPGELAMVQLIVGLAYDALLGAQLVKLLGGSFELLEHAPERSHSVGANLTAELLHLTDPPADQRVVLEHLRDVSALADWQRRGLARDCASMLGIAPDGLPEHVRSCDSDELLAVATVIARAADRAAHTSPKATRRIERARRIGLGTTDRTRGSAG